MLMVCVVKVTGVSCAVYVSHFYGIVPTLFNLYTSDLPVTRSCRFIYANDICCALQAETFSKIECTLTADLAHLQILSSVASETQHVQDCDNCFLPA